MRSTRNRMTKITKISGLQDPSQFSQFRLTHEPIFGRSSNFGKNK
jgi:hypothetical protein